MAATKKYKALAATVDNDKLYDLEVALSSVKAATAASVPARAPCRTEV